MTIDRVDRFCIDLILLYNILKVIVIALFKLSVFVLLEFISYALGVANLHHI